MGPRPFGSFPVYQVSPFFFLEIAKILILRDLPGCDLSSGPQNIGNKGLVRKIFRNKDLGGRFWGIATPGRGQDIDFAGLAGQSSASSAKSWKQRDCGQSVPEVGARAQS